MKIEEKDLVQLFENEPVELVPDEEWIEAPPRPAKVGVKKPVKQNDELAIKKLRRSIHRIKTPPKAREGNVIETFLKFCFVIGIIGFFSFIFVNYPSFAKQLSWAYYNDYLGKSAPGSEISASPAPSAKPSPVPSKTVESINPPVVLPDLENKEGNYIKIQKIGVDAPVVWNVEEANILEELKNGVVHYKGTSLPGEGGNVFIVGHSSNYFWVESNFNQIFALLDKLVNGDRIEIRKGFKSYFYDVSDKKVISPENVEVLNSLDKETLTLMTCWPIGTNINRLVVLAELKYSD